MPSRPRGALFWSVSWPSIHFGSGIQSESKNAGSCHFLPWLGPLAVGGLCLDLHVDTTSTHVDGVPHKQVHGDHHRVVDLDWPPVAEDHEHAGEHHADHAVSKADVAFDLLLLGLGASIGDHERADQDRHDAQERQVCVPVVGHCQPDGQVHGALDDAIGHAVEECSLVGLHVALGGDGSVQEVAAAAQQEHAYAGPKLPVPVGLEAPDDGSYHTDECEAHRYAVGRDSELLQHSQAQRPLSETTHRIGYVISGSIN